MMPYKPEGFYTLPPSQEKLRNAMETGEILQAMCLKCDECHDLQIDLGPIQGIIPREEVLLESREGQRNSYNIRSRVGKAVSFRVLGFDRNGRALLSRKAAQKEARAYFLSALRPGDVIGARVQAAADFGVFCDIGCGFPALMRIERCCISRLESTAQRYVPGQNIFAAVLSADDETMRIVLTGREVLGTWEENAVLFHEGETVTGFVRSILPYGIFIELTPNLSGLCEYREDLKPGDRVSVYIRSIQYDRHKI